MYPTVHYEIARARTADLRAQAQRDALARAARQARRQQHDHGRCSVGGRPATVLARFLDAVRPARRQSIARPRAA
jgi:hypothetical protein